MAIHRLASLAIAVLIAVLMCGWAEGVRSQDLYHSDGRWLDDRAQGYKLDALHGTPTVLTLAYGACRRVCSTSLRMLEMLQSVADQRHVALNFVVVGIDPGQDRPADWADYRAARKLTRTNWQFLTGDEQSVRQLANGLGVHYWRYGEHTLHDFKIVLLSPDGKLVRSIDRFDQDVAVLLP
jgi:cytochrome oxidase Cu insertion factor (SCO1/SenC/PrrC family)